MNSKDFDTRIKKLPLSDSWYNSDIGAKDGFVEHGDIDYSGLSDHQKLALYVYAWNKSEVAPSKNGAAKYFGWSKYKVQKIVRESQGLIISKATFSHDTGLITGRGYYYNQDVNKFSG